MKELLINISLPNGETDLVVRQGTDLASDLHREVILIAGNRLEVNDSDVLSKYGGHHYALDMRTLTDMGMYSGCSVSVQHCNRWVWTVLADIPNGATLKIPVAESTLASDFHKDVVQRAAEYFDSSPSDLYSLFRGKHYHHHKSLTIKDIGMYDKCRVDVMTRIKGGVCVKNRPGGTKRKVCLTRCYC